MKRIATAWGSSKWRGISAVKLPRERVHAYRGSGMDMLQDLNREGHTIVMVTHNVGNAKRAGRTIEIRDGQVVSN